MSSPELDLAETSRILLKKAEEDAIAVREFGTSPEIADSIIGFHAPQAVEKWLKAVTAARGVRHEDELLDAESLDREILVALVDEVAEWVAIQLGPASE